MTDKLASWIMRVQFAAVTMALILSFPAATAIEIGDHGANAPMIRQVDGGGRISATSRAADASTVAPTPTAPDGRQLRFADEFEHAGGPDTTRWRHKITDEWQPAPELQTYTTDPANSRVVDGQLILTALADGAGGWTSARLQTRQFFHYGRIEARLQLPQGMGVWPAFWLLGDDSEVGWPACGEVDIVEAPTAERGRAFGGTHQPGSAGEPVGSKDLIPPTLLNDPAGWHTYAVDWRPGAIDFFIDGRPTGTVTRQAIETKGGVWVFDERPQQIILNVAVGGWGGVPGPWSEQVMNVDWVRVWSPE